MIHEHRGNKFTDKMRDAIDTNHNGYIESTELAAAGLWVKRKITRRPPTNNAVLHDLKPQMASV